jgi:hypothetical protein
MNYEQIAVRNSVSEAPYKGYSGWKIFSGKRNAYPDSTVPFGFEVVQKVVKRYASIA